MTSAVEDLDLDLEKANLAKDHDTVKSATSVSNDPYQGVIRSNYRARDITVEFTNASKALRTGQLVRDESFTLFDSVQALEIMDPKMDTGLLQYGETLEDNYDVGKILLPEEVIGIMDQLLSYEMSWHQGYPLAQNLFSSLYIDYILAQNRQPKDFPKFDAANGLTSTEAGGLVHLVLMSYCIGVIKSCDIVMELIQSQQYYEEEDFNTHTFTRNMLTDLDDDLCLKMLMEAEEWLLEQTEIAEDYASALILRLRIRRDFYDAILPTFSEALTLADWQDMQARIRDLIKSHSLGKAVDDAFSSKVQRRLASTVPPRPITDLKFEDACQDLLRLYEDLQSALQLSHQNPVNDLEHLLSILLVYSARELQPSPLARAELQSVILSEGRIADAEGIRLLLWKSLNQALPNVENYLNEQFWRVENANDQRHKCARAMDYFLEHATAEYTNIIRAACQNRCRVRRNFTNIIRDLDALQNDLLVEYSPQIDLNSNPKSALKDAKGRDFFLKTSILFVSDLVGSFVLHWIQRLEFEQELYQSHELSHMYHLMAQHAVARAEKCDRQILVVKAIPSLEKRKLFFKSKDEQHEVDKIVARLLYQQSHSIAFARMAESLCMLHMILTKLEDLRQGLKQPLFTIETLKWESRLRPYSNLSFGKSLQGFPDYPQALNAYNEQDLEEIVQQAQDNITSANKWLRTAVIEARENAKANKPMTAWEVYNNNDLQETFQACVTIGVALATLKKGMSKYKDDLEKHVIITRSNLVVGRWIVPKITMK